MSKKTIASGTHLFRNEGLTIAYEARGSGPVCVIHSGGPGVRSSYLRIPQLEEFATMIYLDPVGTGDSSRLPDGDYSVARYAEIAHRLIRSEFDGPVTFLGHSHGGFVGLQLALDFPGDLSGLALYSTIPNWEGDALVDAARGMKSFRDRFPGDFAAEDALNGWLESEVPATAEEHLRHLGRLLPAYLADFRSGVVDVATLANGLKFDFDPNRLPDSWDVREQLTSISIPTLILAGKFDWICRPHRAAQMWQDIPGATLQAFNTSGHFAHLEQTTLFVDTLRRFIEDGSDLPSHLMSFAPR